MRKMLTYLSLFISSIALGQTGPGGVGSNDGSSSLELWIMADSCVRTGGYVTSVSDLSGNNINFTVNGGPQLQFNFRNEQTYFYFDGVDDYFSTNLDISPTAFDTIMVFCVYYSDGQDDVGALWGNSDGDFDRFLIRADDYGPGCDRGLSTGSTCNNYTNLFPQNDHQFISSTYIEDSSYASKLTINNFPQNSFTSDVEPGTSNDLQIAALGNGTQEFEGRIAEIFIYSKILNFLEQILIFNYLSSRYDITMDSQSYEIYDFESSSDGGYFWRMSGIGNLGATNGIIDSTSGSSIMGLNNHVNSGSLAYPAIIWADDNEDASANNVDDIPSNVDARMTRTWRIAAKEVFGSTFTIDTIDVAWNLSEYGSVDAADLRLLIDTDNDTLFADESPISGAIDKGNGIFEFEGVASIANGARITLATADSDNTLLPVTLSSFKGIKLNNGILLNWITESEKNNSHFVIERSNKDLIWNDIEIINGNNNSDKSIQYEYFDDNISIDKSYYYRLKQVDFDGEYEYSNIVFINALDYSNNSLHIFPNPASNRITINCNLEGDNNIEFFNVNGQIVQSVTQISQNGNQYTYDISNLIKGIYFIRNNDQTRYFIKD